MTNADRAIQWLMFIGLVALILMLAFGLGQVREDIDNLTPTTTNPPEQAHE